MATSFPSTRAARLRKTSGKTLGKKKIIVFGKFARLKDSGKAEKDLIFLFLK